jgi:hypothetical protein
MPNTRKKPFDRREVFRSVKSAWQHWYGQIPMRAAAMTAMNAAS